MLAIILSAVSVLVIMDPLVQAIPRRGLTHSEVLGLGREAKSDKNNQASGSDWLSLPMKRKLKVLEHLNDESVLKELEELVGHLGEEQLVNLENILAENLDGVSEFKLMMDELKGIGLEENHVNDIYNKAKLMHDFLLQVPEISSRLELDAELDLLDHIQLYLLGLPNKLGPLGFIAMRHVLQESATSPGGEIVDVIIEPISSSGSGVVGSGEENASYSTRGKEIHQSSGSEKLNRRRRQADLESIRRDFFINRINQIVSNVDSSPVGPGFRDILDSVFTR